MTSSFDNVEVRVRLSISRILEIDIVGQTFTAEFQLEASWLDAALAGKIPSDSTSDEYENMIVSTETRWAEPDGLRVVGSDGKYFSPMIRFRNSIELEEVEEWGQIFPKANFGIVCYRLRTRGKFQQCMDLHSFPLDSQDLVIVLTSQHEANTLNPSIQEPTDKRYAFKRVDLRQNLSGKYRSFTNARNFTFSNEYIIKEGVKFTPGITEKDESASLRQYPTLTMAAVVTRKVGYWAYNVVLPLYLITAVSCASFAVPPEEIADRCSITMTMMLTTVAYKYLISDRLPTISYLTLIDLYVLFTMLVQVLFVVLIVVSGGIATSRQEAANSQPNQIRFAVVLVIMLTIVHIALFVLFSFVRSRENRLCSAISNKLWLRPLKFDSTIQTLHDDFLTAKQFLHNQQSHQMKKNRFSAIMTSSFQSRSSRNGFLAQKGNTSSAETDCNEDESCLALSVQHWTWEDAVSTWSANGNDPDKLRSSLQETFSVLTFQDEVSADEFMRVLVYFALDNSPNKPLLKSFRMEENSEGIKGAIVTSSLSANGKKKSSSAVVTAPQAVSNRQEIKVEKLHPDWAVFSTGVTFERSRKFKSSTVTRITIAPQSE